MRNALLAVMFVSMIGSGCYTGRTAGAKKANYVINGMALVIGTALLVSASSDGGGSCSGDASCVGGAVGSVGGAAIGALLAGGGLVGIGITAIVPTRVPDPDVIEVGRPTRAQHSQVTAPGLQPATVSFR